MKSNIHKTIEALQKTKRENEALLYEVIEAIEKSKKRIKHHTTIKQIDSETHSEIFETLVKCITILGKMSSPIFEKQDEIEEYYTITYLSNTNIGRLLYEKQMHNLHREYDLNKNRCYFQIDLLDDAYKNANGKYPPNYNTNVR